ncbi:hypothetical protein Q4557_19745 [Shewanella sp. 5_MG-2023]|uniref:hypothetical protein n=1 Tax=Shewanella sp. 5_MG-2023 TaxID=3062656 RepID=UPI0026E1B076|nr:hypothetical protein [Shewanella sp. 5_MG-2023]MDO6642179.1 hypothetical protein [Shewanella sp. 5_MG-2023]
MDGDDMTSSDKNESVNTATNKPEVALKKDVEDIRSKLLEQEHRTINIIGQLIKPPKNWTEEDKRANKRAFYWTIARFFIPGLGPGSGTGLIAIASVALLAFQSLSLNTQTELLADQTQVISEELELRRQEIESLRPVLTIVPRRSDKHLRIANEGTREARVETISITASNFEQSNGEIEGFPPYSVFEKSLGNSCTLRVEQRMRDDTLIYPIKHEGSREKEFLLIQRVCDNDDGTRWSVWDFDELKNINTSICYCMQDRDRCWEMHGKWYSLGQNTILNTRPVKSCN